MAVQHMWLTPACRTTVCVAGALSLTGATKS
jgi:hypothetical protein